MDKVTLGQIAVGIGIILTLWGFSEKVKKSFNEALEAKLKPMHDKLSEAFEKKIEPIAKTQEMIKSDVNMLSDVCYQMLDHMATDNNTGGMKKALDQYNEYNRHN